MVTEYLRDSDRRMLPGWLRLGGYELEMTKILSEMDYLGLVWAYVLWINW